MFHTQSGVEFPGETRLNLADYGTSLAGQGSVQKMKHDRIWANEMQDRLPAPVIPNESWSGKARSIQDAYCVPG